MATTKTTDAGGTATDTKTTDATTATADPAGVDGNAGSGMTAEEQAAAMAQQTKDLALERANLEAERANLEAEKARAAQSALMDQLNTLQKARADDYARHQEELRAAEERRAQELAAATAKAGDSQEKQRQALDLLLVLNDLDTLAKTHGHSLPILLDHVAKSFFGVSIMPATPTTTDDLVTKS